MSTILHIPGGDPRRARAVKNVVAKRCRDLGLCREATDRCIGKAFSQLRTGASAGWAMAEAIKLARRIAGASQRGDFGGAA